MADQDRNREEGSQGRDRGQEGEALDVPGPVGDGTLAVAELPAQSPLFHAEQAARYDRQALIGKYEAAFDCRLVVLIDFIFEDSVTFLEELIYDADPSRNLHLLLASPGGDGETAVRLARSIQARCRHFTVIVPDKAKSAATILCMGAHHILMGPTSDLGPVDPQFQLPDGSLAGAKDIIAAVDHATTEVQSRPETYPIHAALLGDITALMVQQARSALARTSDLVEEALKSNPERKAEEIDQLKAKLRTPLIELPKSHAAIFGADDAETAGLPVLKADPAGEQWQLIWRLWAKYYALGPPRVYEGLSASKVMLWPVQVAQE